MVDNEIISRNEERAHGFDDEGAQQQDETAHGLGDKNPQELDGIPHGFDEENHEEQERRNDGNQKNGEDSLRHFIVLEFYKGRFSMIIITKLYRVVHIFSIYCSRKERIK